MIKLLPNLLLFSKTFKDAGTQISNYLDIPGWKEALTPVDGPIPLSLIKTVLSFAIAYMFIRIIFADDSEKTTNRR